MTGIIKIGHTGTNFFNFFSGAFPCLGNKGELTAKSLPYKKPYIDIISAHIAETKKAPIWELCSIDERA